MSTNFVFVLDTDRRPLSPCHPARARALLKQGKAAVLRRFPFTIILTRSVPDAHPQPCQVKLDPGSKTTGVAIVQNGRVIWAAEIIHRGGMIKKKLADRSARRRNRRTCLRYRKPSYRTKAQIRNAKATYKRKRAEGWLPPSLQHRIETTLTWITRFIRFAPIGALTQELVRFEKQQADRSVSSQETGCPQADPGASQETASGCRRSQLDAMGAQCSAESNRHPGHCRQWGTDQVQSQATRLGQGALAGCRRRRPHRPADARDNNAADRDLQRPGRSPKKRLRQVWPATHRQSRETADSPVAADPWLPCRRHREMRPCGRTDLTAHQWPF